MKNRSVFFALPLSLLMSGSAMSAAIYVDFDQNNVDATAGFTNINLSNVNTPLALNTPTALGSSGGRAVTLTLTNYWQSLSSSLTGVTATNAPTWFQDPAGTVTQDDITRSTPGLSAGDTAGSFTLGGFLATDRVTVEILGVRDTNQQDATATFTLGGVNSTSGASGFNYETSTNTTTGTPPTVYNPLYGQAMVWTLTGATSYTLNMNRTTGAPAISAMSVNVVPEPSSAMLVLGAGAGLLFLRRRA